MGETITVAVSPFYGRDEWYDELSTIKFEKDNLGFIRTYVIPVETTDLTNIRKAIRINALILVEGNLPDEPEVKPEPPVTEPEEEKEEPVVEAKAATKKKAVNKK